MDHTNSYENQNGVSSTHILDHILALTRAKDQMVDTGVLHWVESKSDHQPIYAIIKTEHITDKESFGDVFHIKSKPKWNDAIADKKLEFNDLLFRGLVNLSIPEEAISCRDVHYKNKEHTSWGWAVPSSV